jgi:hypothetical protein
MTHLDAEREHTASINQFVFGAAGYISAGSEDWPTACVYQMIGQLIWVQVAQSRCRYHSETTELASMGRGDGTG